MFSIKLLLFFLFVYFTPPVVFGDLTIGDSTEFSCEEGNLVLKIIPGDYAKYGIENDTDAVYISQNFSLSPNSNCKDLLNNFASGLIFQVNSSSPGCEAEIRELTTGYEFIYTLRAHEDYTTVRRRNIVSRFICAYNKNYELITSYTTTGSGSPLGSPLQFTPQIQMYVMRSDDNKILDNGNTISSGTQLYVEVDYEPAEEGNYGVVLTSCSARKTPSDAESVVEFMNNGCAVVNNIDTDNSELVVNNEGNSTSSFSFTSFTWQNSHTDDQQQMTISCQAEKCLMQDDACNKICNNKKVTKRRFRRKRNLIDTARVESVAKINTIATEECKNKHCSDICQVNGKCGCFTGRVLGADKKTCKDKNQKKK